MKAAVFGAGLMGTAITYDLIKNTSFEQVKLIDYNINALDHAKNILKGLTYESCIHDLSNENKTRDLCSDVDVVISAVPYFYNLKLTNICIDSGSHFIDLGGNNDIVNKQRDLFKKAENAKVTIIPDCGLAPGLVSIITKDIVDQYSDIEYVKLRVGGLPVNPKPPLNYQIVFSPNGLINEYLEDAIILKNGKISKKKSMTEIETIIFPEPLGEMEAFITSGGCSTLPYSYKNKIKYLDYKTIRYKGHCEKFKTILDLGFGNINPIKIKKIDVIPRDLLMNLLEKSIPNKGKDVVLLKVTSRVYENKKPILIEYNMIDYYDESTNLSAMMRTTGFPVSIIADLILKKNIDSYGVFCIEEIIPTKIFFKELNRRNINIKISKKYGLIEKNDN